MRRRHHISQTQIDFLCLAIFGARALPDAMAERIAARREFARGLADAFDRHPDLGPPSAAPLEAVAAVG